MSATTYHPPNDGSLTTEVLPAGRHVHRRVLWQAILAGVIIAVSIQVLLGLLGAGIGLGMVRTVAGASPDAGSFGIGAGFWWLVSNLVALACGGYAAAWMAGLSDRFDGMLHGVVTWGISMLLTLYLLSSAIGGLVGGALSVTGSTLSAAGDAVKSAAPQVAQAAGVSPDAIQQQAQSYLQPAASTDPATMSSQDAQKAVASELSTYAAGGSDAAAAKDRIIAITAAQAHISKDDAAKRFDNAQAKVAQAKDKAVQAAKAAADASASAASTGSFLAFVTLLLGAFAAAFGGATAVRRRVLVARTTTVSHPAR